MARIPVAVPLAVLLAVLLSAACEPKPSTVTQSSATPPAATGTKTTLPATSEPTMTNAKHLKEARTHTEDFEKTNDPETLRDAYMALENVSLVDEPDPSAQRALRTETLRLWLQMLAILDKLLDPKFDPDVAPELSVQPPPTKGGVVFPPGADPSVIDDPLARERYAKEIEANNAKIIRYNMQVKLHRLEERIPPRAEAFIRDYYTPAAVDQDELKQAVGELIENPARKQRLLQLAASH